MVQVVASAAGQCIGKTTGQVGHQVVLQIPNARLWSPDDPFLYDLEVSVVSASHAAATFIVVGVSFMYGSAHTMYT